MVSGSLGGWNGSKAGSQTLPGLGNERNYSFRLTITEAEVSAQASKHHSPLRGWCRVFLSTNDPVYSLTKETGRHGAKHCSFLRLSILYPGETEDNLSLTLHPGVLSKARSPVTKFISSRNVLRSRQNCKKSFEPLCAALWVWECGQRWALQRGCWELNSSLSLSSTDFPGSADHWGAGLQWPGQLWTSIHVPLTSLGHAQGLSLHFVSFVTALGINLIQTLIMFIALAVQDYTTQSSLAFFQTLLFCLQNSM